MSNLVQMGSITLAATYWINSPIKFDRDELEQGMLLYVSERAWKEVISIYEELQ